MAMAEEICKALEPVTTRREIVGSLRRRKPEVGDIEIVCAPVMVSTLLGDKAPALFAIRDVLGELGTLCKDGDKLKSVTLRSGVVLELHIVSDPAAWGYKMTICTGDQDFSHLAVSPSNRMITLDGGGQHAGYLPPFYRIDGCRVVHHTTGDVFPTLEEDDFLAVLGLRGLSPVGRSVQAADELLKGAAHVFHP